ncbi:MAG: 2,5-diamino-6-(ribosylamino)-4(3H)-pyrimidinone 5'-phosphate reductase [Euryarchaeota archaeon]|nr:2,5-diamino-6-(ribosylamino)-4(3H)-pyrimidinone 5'-phosphate reductase [Euryarchaeota archaeon]
MSADGRIAGRERRQTSLSGPRDRGRVDGLRAACDAILVGIGTVLSDDPGLRVHSEARRRARVRRGLSPNPLRVVVDSRARCPPGAEWLHRGEGPRFLLVSRRAPRERGRRLEERAVVVDAGSRRVDLPRALDILHRRGVRHLLVEGGATLNHSLLAGGLVDEARVYVAPRFLGGGGAPGLVEGAGFPVARAPRARLAGVRRLDDGLLLVWRFSTRPCPREFRDGAGG